MGDRSRVHCLDLYVTSHTGKLGFPPLPMAVAVLCRWEGSRMSGIAPVDWSDVGPTGLQSPYINNGLRKGDEHHAIHFCEKRDLQVFPFNRT